MNSLSLHLVQKPPVRSGAYRLGQDRKDVALQARARILQSAIESGKTEEQIVQGGVATRSIDLAVEYARQALDYANKTQNRQLIAEALFTLGVALVHDGELDEARQCCDHVGELISPDGRDYAWKQMHSLKKKLNAVGNIDSLLREWSSGSVGKKTFRQITEEFASIVIPKVWRREGCKISRVATRLSISPKKVRRILRGQGISPGLE